MTFIANHNHSILTEKTPHNSLIAIIELFCVKIKDDDFVYK